MTRAKIILVLSSALLATACASGPKHKAPPNGDGSQQSRQFSGTAAKSVGLLFVGMDTDGDYRVSADELERGLDKEWASMPGQRVGAIAFRNWSRSRLGSPEAQPTFIAFDSDFSGTIGKPEFLKTLTNEFRDLDTNSDGFLSRDEMSFTVQDRSARGEGNASRQQNGRGKKEGQRPPR